MTETELDRQPRKPRVVLPAREALFLRRAQNSAVLDQRRGAVVVERGDAEHSHVRSEQGVNEWRDSAALRHHDERSHDREHQDHWEEPEFLARPHEPPEFGYKIHIRLPKSLILN